MAKVLVVAQLPPPYLGQPIMLEHLVRSEMPGVEMRHLPMRLSEEVSDVGRFRWFKFFRLFSLIGPMIYERFAWRPQILYYAPPAATRFSVFRDFVILIPTRFLFPKTVFHFHASGHAELYGRLPKWQQWLFKLAYGNVEGAIRLSDLTSPDGKAVLAQREYIVPNGIEDPTLQLDGFARKARPREDRPLQLLYLSALYEAKGLMFLIDACDLLRTRGISFQLEVVGGFSSKEFESQVRDRIAKLKLEPMVNLRGQLLGQAKLEAFASADVFCHPTLHDTFPIVLLEAMAFGLPIVASRVGGIPSIVDEGVTGFLVEARDATSIADRLTTLAEHDQLKSRLGVAGREKFLREFILSRHIERMRNVFLDVARGTPVKDERRVAKTLATTP